MKRNLYLFVIWSRGRRVKRQIMADLAEKYAIRQEYEVRWRWRDGIHNFGVFYRHHAFFSWLRKCIVCGFGAFRVIIVEDVTSLSAEESTRKVVENKALYRSWAGGRWRVHGSATYAEARYQYWLLFGKRLECSVDETYGGEVQRVVIDKPLRFELGILDER